MEYTIFCKNNIKIFLLAVVCLQTTETAEQVYYSDIVSSWKVNPDLERNHSSTKLSIGIRKVHQISLVNCQKMCFGRCSILIHMSFLAHSTEVVQPLTMVLYY